MYIKEAGGFGKRQDFLPLTPVALDAMSSEKVYDAEKGSKSNLDVEVAAHDDRVVDASTEDPHMHRALKGRQVSMIAIVRFFYASSNRFSFLFRLALLERVSSWVPVRLLRTVAPSVPFSVTSSSVCLSV